MSNLEEAIDKCICGFLMSGSGMFRAQHIPIEDVYRAPPPKPYGCHNRAPIVTVCKPTCQYTYTALGQADERCHGCKERSSGAQSG